MSTGGAKPELVRTVADLRSAVSAARAKGLRIGLVPTMGALHEGHVSLVRASRAECQLTVVSIYVNPTQFGPREDLAKYPRTLDADLAALAGSAEVVFVPADGQMYPPGFDTWVDVSGVTRRWEGECRPGHFRGVATVVLKLLNQARPDVAFFGQKDYQQALVIRRMVEDLDVPVAIRVCPTVREADGLAMSSRNRYLTADQRQQALVLWQSLNLAARLVGQRQRDAGAIIGRMKELIGGVPGAAIDYVALADPDSLEPVTSVDQKTVALLAVRIGSTRLIDNMLIG